MTNQDRQTRLAQLVQEIAALQAQVAQTPPADLPAVLTQLQTKLDEQTRLQEQLETPGQTKNSLTANISDGSTSIQAGRNVANAQSGGLSIGGNVHGSVNQNQVGGNQMVNPIRSERGVTSDPSKIQDPYNLRHKMTKYLMKQEVLNLIHDLEIEVNLLSGESLGEKIIALVDYCQKRGQTEGLIKLCEKANGSINWWAKE